MPSNLYLIITHFFFLRAFVSSSHACSMTSSRLKLSCDIHCRTCGLNLPIKLQNCVNSSFITPYILLILSGNPCLLHMALRLPGHASCMTHPYLWIFPSTLTLLPGGTDIFLLHLHGLQVSRLKRQTATSNLSVSAMWIIFVIMDFLVACSNCFHHLLSTVQPSQYNSVHPTSSNVLGTI